ncbi:MAG TPA: RidA family protein [Firmicutes bacterium]|nr:RidA family protein [Bacillota bacterium]
MSAEAKILQMKLTVPEAPAPVANYLPAKIQGDLLFVSGQIPVWEGKLHYRGKIGRELTVSDGYQAARLCLLNCLGVIRAITGSLDRVKNVVKLTGYVHSDSNFYQQPQVVDGASDLLVEIFGEKGKHARAAVGVGSLPQGAAVEIELLVEISR